MSPRRFKQKIEIGDADTPAQSEVMSAKSGFPLFDIVGTASMRINSFISNRYSRNRRHLKIIFPVGRNQNPWLMPGKPGQARMLMFWPRFGSVEACGCLAVDSAIISWISASWRTCCAIIAVINDIWSGALTFMVLSSITDYWHFDVKLEKNISDPQSNYRVRQCL